MQVRHDALRGSYASFIFVGYSVNFAETLKSKAPSNKAVSTKLVMQKFYLGLAGAVVLAVIAGASLATVFRPNAPDQQPFVQTSPEQPRSLQTAEDTASPISATNPNRANPTTTTPQTQSQPSVVASQPKLDDFPHQRISLPDEVKPGSEFAQFRQRLRQAISERNAQFLKSILPHEITLGFGAPIPIG